VDSFARPGGNLTAITNFSPEVSAKRLELLKEVVPGLARVAYAWNPANQAGRPDWIETQAAAETLRLQVRPIEARSPHEVDDQFAAIVGNRPDGLIVGDDIVFIERRQHLVDVVASIGLPTMYSWGLFVPPGGLMAYGINGNDAYSKGAALVDKILNGARPADLPVERPTRFDLSVNLKTAQALGLTIPSSVVQQATQVVQ
jgi:putative ABC transport system substrate-binding protein